MNLGKLLKSGSKSLFQHESSAAVEKPWAEPSSPLLNGAVRVLGASAGTKITPVHFLTWENSLGGHGWEFVDLYFSVPQLHMRTLCSLKHPEPIPRKQTIMLICLLLQRKWLLL